MYINRQIANNKEPKNNLKSIDSIKIKNIYNINKYNNQNNFTSFISNTLLKSKSITSSKTSRGKKLTNMKESFENLLFNKTKNKNLKTKNNKSSITIIKSKSKNKNKNKCLSKKPTKNKIKEPSSHKINEIINNILLVQKNRNKNYTLKHNYNSKTNTFDINYIYNCSKTCSNSIRSSLTSIKRNYYIPKQKNYTLKYNNFNNNTMTINKKVFNKLINNNKDEKWNNLLVKLENLKVKTNCLLSKYCSLTENLNNELKDISQDNNKQKYIHNKNCNYIMNYNNDNKIIDKFLSERYIHTEYYN